MANALTAVAIIVRVGETFCLESIMDIEIQDIIARDVWESTQDDGTKVRHEIIVGRPIPIPCDKNGDWICPVSIQNFTDRIVPVYGVGSVDALMNAMVLVRKLFDKVDNIKLDERTTS